MSNLNKSKEEKLQGVNIQRKEDQNGTTSSTKDYSKSTHSSKRGAHATRSLIETEKKHELKW